MEHLVTLNSGAKEIENLLNGTKSMIIYGANEKCSPYGCITEGDILYLSNNTNPSEIVARGIVSSVYNSYCLSKEESYEMIIRNQDKLVLPDKLFYKWAGKKYLVLIGVRDVEKLHPPNFVFNSSLQRIA